MFLRSLLQSHTAVQSEDYLYLGEKMSDICTLNGYSMILKTFFLFGCCNGIVDMLKKKQGWGMREEVLAF